ncbi:hypothetical protein BDZ97DRAFT_1926033 [Flammula alnicola]|nr:hypothetical protein BDZ97DRAFT_1926033 [Flammula alnicola]
MSTSKSTRGITPDRASNTSNTTTAARTSSRLQNNPLQLSVINEELEEIQDTPEARRCLEKLELIVPPGQTMTHDLLSTALHHISAVKGVPKQAKNAIRSVAFLLEEMEVNTLHETVRDSVTSQLNDMCADLRDFITDTTKRIDNHLSDKMKELTEATKTLLDTATATLTNTASSGGTMAPDVHTLNYKQALMHPPPNIDPCIVVKEGIRLRQFMLEGVTRESKIGKMNAMEAKKTVNEALATAGAGGHKARSALRQNKAGLLHGTWAGLSFKKRPYNVIVFNVPTGIDPSNPDHLKEICETNDIDEDSISAIRWVKPTDRQDKESQSTAHMIITFTDVNVANRSIIAGLIICHRKVWVAKCKKEPVRCMKCHGWNHVAWECVANTDTCGTCAGKGHWTKDCPDKKNKNKWCCVSCNTGGHASWSRECPVFLWKCEELDKRTPENHLPFFPATEPWTWSLNPSPPIPQYGQGQGFDAQPRGKNQRDRNQMRQEKAPSGRRYERQTWDRPAPVASQAHTDKPNFPDPSSPIPPELTNNETEPGQIFGTQDTDLWNDA